MSERVQTKRKDAALARKEQGLRSRAGNIRPGATKVCTRFALLHTSTLQAYCGRQSTICEHISTSQSSSGHLAPGI